MQRRDALLLGGAVAVAVAIPPILRRLPSEFEFQPLSGAPGFRRLRGGTFSSGVDPFFGLNTDDAPAAPHDKPICRSLFGPESWKPARVPVAIFTDVNCPYCKVLENRLVALRRDGAPINLIWHDLPLLGPASVRSARAVMAAQVLGQGHAARDYVNARVLRPGPLALRTMALTLGLDPDAFIAIEASATVDARLTESLALGRRLGIPGTPGTVIGRTLVIGAIKDADLRRLIALETENQESVCS